MELGHPIMATPFSQLVGIQAVLNVMMADRYALVPDEIIQYALGHYGPLARPIAPDVMDRILAQPRAAEFINWTPPQPTMAEIRMRFPLGISDEELLLRLLTSDAEVDAMQASALTRIDPRKRPPALLRNLKTLIAESKSSTAVRITTPAYSLDLRRQAQSIN
jgi:oxaloacetate decarboxylase alpha subunit